MAINLIDKMHEMYLCDRVTIDITKTLDRTRKKFDRH